jgi:hypothetical protein
MMSGLWALVAAFLLFSIFVHVFVRRVWGWGAMRYKFMDYMEMDFITGGDPDAKFNLYSYTRSARSAQRALSPLSSLSR